MGLESATYISQLVATNPVGATDPTAQGDDHIRLIKATLQNTFPNINAAVNASDEELNQLVGVTGSIEAMRGMPFTSQAAPYAIAAGDNGKFVDISSTGTVTLGALAAGFACMISNVSGGNVTLTSSSGNLRWQNGGGGALPTGNRTLSAAGCVSVYRDGTNWRVVGAGLS
jgi:hypothetical protein